MMLQHEQSKQFSETGYTIVKRILDQNTTDIVSKYLENRINQTDLAAVRTSKYGWDIKQNTTISSFACYGDPLIEVLMLQLKPVVENIVKKELLPTYTYSRIYTSGSDDVLQEHTDRPSCEYSVTINIATTGSPNSIIMNSTEWFLEPGDGVIYLGCEIPHARKPLRDTGTDTIVQIMLHYVDKNGINSDYKYDKRNRVGYGS